MNEHTRPTEELIAELHALRARVAELEDQLAAQTDPQDQPDEADPNPPQSWRQQADLGLIMDTLRAHLFIKDLDGRYLRVNKALAEAMDIPQAEWVGKTAADIFPDDADRYQATDDQIIATGQPDLSLVEHYQSAHGPRWVQMDKVPLQDELGQVIGVLGLAVDITGQVEVETALRDQQVLLESILETVPIGICITDEAGHYTLVNDMYCSIYDFKRDEIIGQHFGAIMTPEQLAVAQQHYTQLLEGDMGIPTERTRRRKDGSTVYIEAANARLVHADGRRSIITVVRDVTDRKVVELERERLIDDLNAFAYMVAHDLKNPLALVMGYADMLMGDATDSIPPEAREYIGHINRASVKMETIINELLTLSMVGQESAFEIVPLDMPLVVHEASHRLRLMIHETQARIQMATPDEWPLGCGHGPWVEEVWANYLSNALKYGGSPPEIEVGATLQENDMVRFWVRDQGPGLTPDQQTRLFVPFTQLAHTKRRGHGLGLSIVHRIMERLNGAVGVESEVGQGSTFWFELPLAHRV